jgi:hypothetical protein
LYHTEKSVLDVYEPTGKIDIFGPGSHVEYLTGTKNRKFVEDHLRIIPAKFGSNWPSGFGSLKCEKFYSKCLEN